jgi:multiple sugar transport system substrate-binding protein
MEKQLMQSGSVSHAGQVIQGAGTRRAVIRALGGAFAGAAATSALAACGTTSSSTAEPQGIKTQAPVTLRYVGSFAASNQTTFGGGAQKLVELFNEKGTPIKVEPIMPSNNRNEAAMTMITAGDPPDLFHALPRDHHPFANLGALLDLAPYIKKDKRAQDVNPMVLEFFARGDVRYAMPNNFSVHSIYFNKDLFNKAGLKTPDQYEKEGKWTVETYMDLARRLTTGQGENKIYGAPWTTDALDQQLAFIWPMGGDMFDKSLENSALDTPEALEAIQLQGDMTHRYGVSPDAEVLRQTGWRGSGGAIAAGRSGMEIMTTDVVGLLVPTTFEKGMAPMPKGKAGRVVRANVIGVHIMKGSKAPDAAWEYAAFQSGPDGAKLMLERHLTVPWLKSLSGSKEHAALLLPWESASAYAENTARVRPTKYPGTFGEVNTLYSKAYNEVKAGTKTARQAMGEIKAQVNDLLKKK